MAQKREVENPPAIQSLTLQELQDHYTAAKFGSTTLQMQAAAKKFAQDYTGKKLRAKARVMDVTVRDG